MSILDLRSQSQAVAAPIFLVPTVASRLQRPEPIEDHEEKHPTVNHSQLALVTKELRPCAQHREKLADAAISPATWIKKCGVGKRATADQSASE